MNNDWREKAKAYLEGHAGAVEFTVEGYLREALAALEAAEKREQACHGMSKVGAKATDERIDKIADLEKRATEFKERLEFALREPLPVRYVELEKRVADAERCADAAQAELVAERGRNVEFHRELLRRSEQVWQTEHALTERLREALKGVLSELGACNDDEKARGRCAGHPMLTRLPCVVGVARKLVGLDS